jgi:mannose-6-phosphate isomerase-like protein (cupin superfamily)
LTAVSEPVLLRPGEGELHAVGDSSLALKATSESTAGTFFLSENVLEPGFLGPPPHIHRELHDMFYVLEGMLTLRLGDETVEAPPGTFVCVPPGVVHTFRNRSTEAVRILNFNTPGGFENYMRELAAAAAAGGYPAPEEIGRIASKYDVQVVS